MSASSCETLGVRAEIKPGGILVCEGNVAITKAGPHNFSIDGVAGEIPLDSRGYLSGVDLRAVRSWLFSVVKAAGEDPVILQ